MPENRTNINHIRSYLQQLEQSIGFIPDFIIGDYIDIMGTTHSISADNVFTKDKFVTEEFRSLGYDFNAVMISASQLGRGAIDAEKISQAHIAGGISKINTSDYVVGIKQDDLMRAKGEINFDIMKSRNSGGVGKKIVLAWDSVSLLISSLRKVASQLSLTKKSRADSIIMGTENISKDKKENNLIGLLQDDE